VITISFPVALRRPIAHLGLEMANFAEAATDDTPSYLCHVTSLSDPGLAVGTDPETRAVAEHADSLKTHSPHC
jgi:hypothetical protein